MCPHCGLILLRPLNEDILAPGNYRKYLHIFELAITYVKIYLNLFVFLTYFPILADVFYE